MFRGIAFIALVWLAPLRAEIIPELARIMDDPAWIGAPVENPSFSWDLREAYCELREPGGEIRQLYRVPLAGGELSVVPEAERAFADARPLAYDQARQRYLFVRDGVLYLRDRSDGTLIRLSSGEANVEEARFAADESLVHYRAGGQWFRVAARGGAARPWFELRSEKSPEEEAKEPARAHELRLISTLAREREERLLRQARERQRKGVVLLRLPEGLRVVASSPSPDERWVLLITEPEKADRGRRGQMPKYVTESGYEETEEVRTRVGRNPPPGQSLWLGDLASGTVRPLDVSVLPGIDEDPLAFLEAGKPAEGDRGRKARRSAKAEGKKALRDLALIGMAWNREGSRLAVMLRAIDNKDRWLAEIELEAAALKPRHRLHDPAWINWDFNDFGWMPDGSTLWFLSEESGFSHFYTLSAGREKPRQHTRGAFEVWRPTVARDGRRVWLMSNHGDPTRAGVYLLDLEKDQLMEVGAHDWIEDYLISPDERLMLLRWSASHMPAQLTVMPALGGEGKVLTDTRSEAYRAISWIGPEFVEIPSRHGAPRPILGKLYRPNELAPGRRYPLVFFVHGAGYLQNVHRGFPQYFREQMFHDLLARRGFFVLDLDFRASKGYGRAWRTAIYRQMGTPELEDYLDALEWIAAREPIDRNRVGIYGGSYGGFITLMAMFKHPEVFKAGAALRPVTDWTSYNHPYTSNILNTPARDPEAYRRSSPIEYAEGLKGHLLISHGMLDDNVFYQDVVRLAQRLIELRKPNWELASYPLERHAFRHPESWYDQYRRILMLFERVLGETGPRD